MAGREEPSPPLLWATHYPRMLAAYVRRGEDGLEEIEEELRTRANARPGGKFSKAEAAYVPTVPLPPLDWRHECGHCRFWVDHGPGKPGECMIVGREGDRWGGKAIHEKAGCALFVPPAGEPAFGWIREQLAPTGADLVRGEYHPERRKGVEIPVTGADDAADRGRGERPRSPPADRAASERDRPRAGRHGSLPDVGTAVAPAGATVGLEPVVDGLAAPVDCAFVDGGEWLLVADQAGLVHLVDGGSRRDEPLLDLREPMVDIETQYDERGLLGLAVHPDGDRLFVRYSAPPREGTPGEFDHTEVLEAFPLDGTAPIDPGDGRALLEIPHPEFNHNAGAVAFGPDGYCYVAMGDGGGEGDDGFGHVEGGNAQDVTRNVLGSILRIDVDAGGDDRPPWRGDDDANPRGPEPYGIPDDNPLVGGEGSPGGGERPLVGADGPLEPGEGVGELYAWGLRNPWRFSFDGDGRLFAGDVGQHLFEEVNVVEKGGNYGWNVREGYHCFDPESPSDPPEDCPDESRRGEPLVDPILEYPHVHEDEVIGSAVVGGHRYEGDAVAALDGDYVFGDWATTQDRPSGRLFAAHPPADGDGQWDLTELVVDGSPNGRPNRNVLGFAADPDGELYLLSSETHVPKGETGAVHRVVPPG